MAKDAVVCKVKIATPIHEEHVGAMAENDYLVRHEEIGAMHLSPPKMKDLLQNVVPNVVPGLLRRIPFFFPKITEDQPPSADRHFDEL